MPRRSVRATILVPVYNSAATLQRCIDSACAQTLRDIEILIADDASTDASAAVADALATKDARIRVIRLGENGGKPKAMNILIAQARGDWLAVLDADDRYHPERLQILIDAAERHGVDMAADNQFHIDSGGAGADEFGSVLRTAFDPAMPDRIVGKADLMANADSLGDFDFGILKPVIRHRFVLDHALRYHEASRLAEDFTYLLTYLVAGGKSVLCSAPLYFWTLPFSSSTRQWTNTGAGAWRYNYREALAANDHFLKRMQEQGETDMVRLLHRRARNYRVMIHYIDAQRMAAERKRLRATITLVAHPSCWPLLGRRVIGRLRRAVRARRDHGKMALPAQ